MTRDELIEGLFHALDADHGATGALEAASVRIFAEATGFEGTDEQWQEQLEVGSLDRKTGMFWFEDV